MAYLKNFGGKSDSKNICDVLRFESISIEKRDGRGKWMIMLPRKSLSLNEGRE